MSSSSSRPRGGRRKQSPPPPPRKGFVRLPQWRKVAQQLGEHLWPIGPWLIDREWSERSARFAVVNLCDNTMSMHADLFGAFARKEVLNASSWHDTHSVPSYYVRCAHEHYVVDLGRIYTEVYNSDPRLRRPRGAGYWNWTKYIVRGHILRGTGEPILVTRSVPQVETPPPPTSPPPRQLSLLRHSNPENEETNQ